MMGLGSSLKNNLSIMDVSPVKLRKPHETKLYDKCKLFRLKMLSYHKNNTQKKQYLKKNINYD
jgi:hypothetical protein